MNRREGRTTPTLHRVSTAVASAWVQCRHANSRLFELRTGASASHHSMPRRSA